MMHEEKAYNLNYLDFFPSQKPDNKLQITQRRPEQRVDSSDSTYADSSLALGWDTLVYITLWQTKPIVLK